MILLEVALLKALGSRFTTSWNAKLNLLSSYNLSIGHQEGIQRRNFNNKI